MTSSKTFILDDLPTDTDALDFQPYVDTLADVCQTASTPLTVGVFGTWGSGKTSLMRMVRKGLPKEYTVAWFDAWKYDKEETLWRAFLLCILSAMRQAKKLSDDELTKLTAMLYRALDLEKSGGVTIDLAKLGAKVAQGAVQIGLSFLPGGTALGKLVEELQKAGAQNLSETAFDAIQRERTKIHIEQVQFLEQFQAQFARLVESRIRSKDGRLVVFVDDLDRCLPEKAIEVLEAIKLFVDVPGCVFLLGLDHKVIERGVEIRYREFNKAQEGQGGNPIDGAHYLEKIIQLPFLIPPVEQADMGDFVQGLTQDWPDAECPKVFAAGLGDNPRQIKRTVNVFLMLWKLAEKREKKLQGRIKPIRLAKVVAIQTIHPELYSLLKETPRYLRELEEYYRIERIDEQDKTGSSVEQKKLVTVGLEKPSRAEPPPALVPLVTRQAVRRILTMHSLELPFANFSGLVPEELRLYFTLTRRAEAPQALVETSSQTFEPQMVRIPAGGFLMGTDITDAQRIVMEGGDDWVEWIKWEQPQHVVELSEYYIGRFPITNHEYQIFIKDTKNVPPQGWDDGQYPIDKGDHPVVNVSWEDAGAYCQWLTSKTNREYRLPTEAEWEKASRGVNGQIYPWGFEFDANNCNLDESGIDDTTPVGSFSPNGDSPFGCADMVGNVCEWCADIFKEDEYENRKGNVIDPRGPRRSITGGPYFRVLRGGSFEDSRRGVRCANRSWGNPVFFKKFIGFRVAFSADSTENNR